MMTRPRQSTGSSFKRPKAYTKLVDLNADSLEDVLSCLNLRELAMAARTCSQFNSILLKRLGREYNRMRGLVAKGCYFLSPAQASTLLRTCRHLACGQDIIRGGALCSGDHRWVGVIKRDGSLLVTSSYANFHLIPLDEGDAHIQASFSSRLGPFGLRFFGQGFLEVGYPFKHRAPGPTSHSFVARFQGSWLKAPMAVTISLFSPPEDDWLRGLLLMLLSGEDPCPQRIHEGPPLALSVRLPRKGNLCDVAAWEPLLAAGITFSNNWH
eukprot:jgi/Botrbrau1/21520/Bobra.174_2s0023.1